MTPLRVCRICGLEANTEAELDQFVRARTSKYGYSNLCKKCHREEVAKQRGHRTSELIKIFETRSTDGILQCHFCGKNITKLEGQDSDSLVFHSLDGDHENWDPENKVPAHRGCHLRDHRLQVERISMKKSMKTPVKIRVDSTTRDALRALKKGGDTFDDVVRRLIDEWTWVDTLAEYNPIRELPDIEKEEG